ncbi:hypothetical protein QA264_06285 [Glaesserella parasuis]|nr:hypothetical protein [Glaesserella parasuis]MDG6280397.1 hypothetical protein [Glaesserella parasuis]MDG6307855.1 hypothetical protein [Glaesserella parasuis]MDG6316442.1 hypothetical protein [Glaesserella parasuis]MDG6343980.1 hypothetical protein [Glaesserella parasuis]MDG6430713.1 hypothetical protein [Glaesserella parasuis]
MSDKELFLSQNKSSKKNKSETIKIEYAIYLRSSIFFIFYASIPFVQKLMVVIKNLIKFKLNIRNIIIVINITIPTKGTKPDDELSSIKIGSAFLYLLFFIFTPIQKLKLIGYLSYTFSKLRQ